MAEEYKDYAWWENILAILFVAAFALVGGLIFAVINGINLGRIKTPGLLGPVKLPPLVAMILFGAVARNMFTWESEAYHDPAASYVRIVCLMVILLRGGLEITFKGKGLIVFLYTIVPCLVEATAVMFVAWLVVGMPFLISYAMGFMCAAVSPAILVPSMLSLAK